ncbi:hypothetical protein [Sphingomonas pokkalii]|uniref:hypothetical protein n=1 Tax=Sphingomonas pokkalii TaxID=2175090 RepID=UPI0010577DDC|nr:hypothetical protein [Sphingomonas pokkalii]
MTLWLFAMFVQSPDVIELRCPGSTTVLAPTKQGSAVVTGPAGTAATASVERTAVDSRGVTEFRIEGDKAFARPPLGFVERKGTNGWLPVKKLVVTDGEISGMVQVDLLTASRFRIDRRTGELTTSGGFRGVCTKLEANDKRAF